MKSGQLARSQFPALRAVSAGAQCAVLLEYKSGGQPAIA